MTVYVSFSGGLDSTTLLARAIAEYGVEEVVAVSFDYGQRHAVELDAAMAITRHFGCQSMILALPRLASPSLTGSTPIPHGHYAEETMRLTVVQGRNLLFASTLVALTQPGDTVLLGVHAGDHAIYNDCRETFIAPLAEAVHAAYEVALIAPYLHSTKAQIAAESATYNAPVALSWSCYEGGAIHCGKCGTCVERAEAFHLAGVTDPTEYADPTFWLTAVEGAAS